VAQLKVKLLPEERKAITKAHPETPEAYTYYLRGRDLFRKVTRPNLLLAREMFEKAAEIDPAYSLAIAGFADCQSFLVWHYAEDIPPAVILKHAERALSLNPDLAEAQASRGLANFLNHDFGNAEEDLRRAILLNPGLFEAHYFLALISYTLKKFERAAEHYERAAEIDPDDFQALSLLQQAYRSLDLNELAKGAARRALARATRAAAQYPENPRPLYHAASALVTLGRVAEARELTARAIGLDPDDLLTKYNVACLYALFGDLDVAIDLLLELLPRAPVATKVWVRHEADFRPLHTHPKWDDVLELSG
jgi:adenylate cyclase